MTDVILVHGAFHGAWCWRKVVPTLIAAGQQVNAITLSGLGDHADRLAAGVGLSSHIDDIIQAVDSSSSEQVVLVAHSYGGAPAVAAADVISDRIAALVLLDGLLPINGYSCDDLRERTVPSWSMDRSDPLAIPVPSATVFGISGVDCAEIEALMTPHPAATLREPCVLSGAYNRIPRRQYHRALRYAAPYFDDSAARATAEGWDVSFHDLPHDMMWTHPDWTAAAILAAT